MNIYVGNLSLEVTEEELRREFIAFGEVVSVTIVNDRYGSGQSRGYGFVNMPATSQGEAAVTALNGKSVQHRMIDVIQALPLSDKKGNGLLQRREVSRYSSRIRQRRY
jgi:RNA recognition motif-containing protein